MLKTYLSAAIQNWAAEKTRQNWRGMWRLKKWAIGRQLSDVQRLGEWVELTGPVFIQNLGVIEVGNRVTFGARMHSPVTIAVARENARLVIEDDVFINYGVDIGLVQEMVIGEKSLIGNDCVLYDTDWHSLDGLDLEIPAAPTRIGRGVWLGARSMVMKGVTIGDNTVVAANSTVTGDLPDHVLAGGTPAKVIRSIERKRYSFPVHPQSASQTVNSPAAIPSHTPLVSVILPTYNRGAMIGRAIRSVLDQTFTDFELIIVDDGSTDHTAMVAASFDDPRISYRLIEHGERSKARNTGIRLSRGKYVAFLDSDDWYLPGKLAVQVGAMQEHPEAGLALGGWQIVDSGGRMIQKVHPWETIPGQPSLDDWLSKAISTPITILVRKDCLEKVGGFDPGLYMAEDVDLHIRLLLAGCASIWTHQEIAVVLAHPSNSLRDWPSVRQGRLEYLEKLFTLPGFAARVKTGRNELTAATHLTLAMQAFEAGLYESAGSELLIAAELDPRLYQQGSSLVVQWMIGHSQYFLVEDPIAFIDRVLGHLPAPFAGLRYRRREILGKAWKSRAWNASKAGDWNAMRRSVLHAVWYDPGCLTNRGILSMLLRSFIRRGPAVPQYVRVPEA